MPGRVGHRGIVALAAACVGLSALVSGLLVEGGVVTRWSFLVVSVGRLPDPPVRRFDDATPVLVAAALGAALALLVVLFAQRAARAASVLVLRGWSGHGDARLVGTFAATTSLGAAAGGVALLVGRSPLEAASAVPTDHPLAAAVLGGLFACAVGALGLQLEVQRHPRRGRRLTSLALAAPALVVLGACLCAPLSSAAARRADRLAARAERRREEAEAAWRAGFGERAEARWARGGQLFADAARWYDLSRPFVEAGPHAAEARRGSAVAPGW